MREAALSATAQSLEPVAAALSEEPTVYAALEPFLGLIDACAGNRR